MIVAVQGLSGLHWRQSTQSPHQWLNGLLATVDRRPIRASNGFVPGQPPLFPDAIVEQMRMLVPAMEEHLLVNPTHYTMVLGNHGASRIADLIDAFAGRCR